MSTMPTDVSNSVSPMVWLHAACCICVQDSVLIIRPVDGQSTADRSHHRPRTTIPLAKAKQGMKLDKMANGTLVMTLPGPLDDVDLIEILKPYSHIRVLHFTDPAASWARFRDGQVHKEYDKQMLRRQARYCCRNTDKMRQLGIKYDREEFEILPEWRREE